MDKIHPVPRETAFFRDNELTICAGVSEMGIYGCYLGRGKDPVVNTALGYVVDVCNGCVFHLIVARYLLRTKPAEVQEGGVAAGYAVIDTPVLVE